MPAENSVLIGHGRFHTYPSPVFGHDLIPSHSMMQCDICKALRKSESSTGQRYQNPRL